MSRNIHIQPKIYGDHHRSMRWYFLLFLLMLGAVIYFFSAIRKDLSLLQEIEPIWLIAAVACQFFTYVISSIIYRNLLRMFPVMTAPSVKELVRAAVIALLFNQLIPSAGLSGNAFFFRFLGRYNYTRRQIFTLIIFELLLFYAAIEFLIIILLTICSLLQHSFYWIKSGLIAGLLVYLVLAITLSITSKKNAFNRVYARMIHFKLMKKLFSTLSAGSGDDEDVIQAINPGNLYNQHKSIAWQSFLLQILLFITDSLTLYVLFLGLGHPISPWIALLALVSAQIASIFPFLPGGLIFYESGMSFCFVQAGSPVALAILVTMVYRLLSFWFPMPAGAWLYKNWLKADEHENKKRPTAS